MWDPLTTPHSTMAARTWPYLNTYHCSSPPISQGFMAITWIHDNAIVKLPDPLKNSTTLRPETRSTGSQSCRGIGSVPFLKGMLWASVNDSMNSLWSNQSHVTSAPFLRGLLLSQLGDYHC